MTASTLETTKTQTAAPWQIDTAHTDVEFAVRHLMISNVRGRFGNVTGTLSIPDGKPGPLALDVSIPIATIDTREAKRDAHLRSADFFDAEKFPAMTFSGKKVVGDTNEAFQLTGELTIRGVSRPVTLDVTIEGRTNDPWGNERLGYSASGKINRSDFGLVWNQLLETGGVAVGEQVKITINGELMRPLPQ